MRAALLLSLFGMCGACTSQPDLALTIDERVRSEWMLPGLYCEAIPFLEQGGYYYNRPGDDTAPQLDREHILPLLKELQSLSGEVPYAIVLDDSSSAWAIVMKLPTDLANRNKLDLFLDQAHASFPGMILEERGYEWLSLDFLDEEEASLVDELDRATG